jgi:HD superfamily phosphodiesterase
MQNFQINDIEEIWKTCQRFVYKTCSNRDSSHGPKHMKQVALNSLNIINNLNFKIEKREVEIIIISSWLHDVADHKYNETGELKLIVEAFLDKNYKETKELILNIIERISFTKEYLSRVNNKKLDWKKVLGERGILYRDIVSDADKIEALGKIGLHRTIIYEKEKYFKNNKKNMSDKDLKKKVLDYCDFKLVNLKDNYIYTAPGKKIAEEKHLELLDEIKKYKLNIV